MIKLMATSIFSIPLASIASPFRAVNMGSGCGAPNRRVSSVTGSDCPRFHPSNSSVEVVLSDPEIAGNWKGGAAICAKSVRCRNRGTSGCGRLAKRCASKVLTLYHQARIAGCFREAGGPISRLWKTSPGTASPKEWMPSVHRSRLTKKSSRLIRKSRAPSNSMASDRAAS